MVNYKISFFSCHPCSRKNSASLRLCVENIIVFAPPLQIPTKVDATPISRPFHETDLERTCSEGEAVLEHKQEKGVNVKKQKFLR